MADPIDPQKTTVRLGLAVSAMLFVVSAVWWAANLSTKVDTLLENSRVLMSRAAEMERRASALETRLAVVEAQKPRP